MPFYKPQNSVFNKIETNDKEFKKTIKILKSENKPLTSIAT